MKSINIYFNDDDYKKLLKAKNGMSWRNFILTLLKEEKIKNG